MRKMERKDPYLYDDVPVLRNLPEIKDAEQLKIVEGDLTKMSMGIVYARDYDKHNTETLQDVHRTIFGGLYEWAGEFRTIPIMKPEEVLGGDTVRYAMPGEIKKQLDAASKEIAKLKVADEKRHCCLKSSALRHPFGRRIPSVRAIPEA